MADVIAIDDGPSPQTGIHRRASSPEFMICEKAPESKRKDASAGAKARIARDQMWLARHAVAEQRSLETRKEA
jgi:hypothetical protein